MFTVALRAAREGKAVDSSATGPPAHRQRDSTRRQAGRARLDKLYDKLLEDAKAELAFDGRLERCSNKCPELRLNRLALLVRLLDARADSSRVRRFVDFSFQWGNGVETDLARI